MDRGVIMVDQYAFWVGASAPEKRSELPTTKKFKMLSKAIIAKAYWLRRASGIVLGAVLLAALPLRVSAAVTMSSFDAKWQSGKVAVNWKTATELNNVGFNILRSESGGGSFSKINYTPSRPECMGSITGCQYSFTDTSVVSGKAYYYRLQSINTSGGTETYSVTAIAADATPTATATTAATATRTRTRTVTATNVPSATNIPSTPTATFAPQYTPTRTTTYPPGVTSPSATPTSLRVAVAQASPTTARAGAASPAAPASPARAGAANPPAPPSISGGTPAATRIALAPQEPTPEDVTEEVENEVENSEESQNARDTRGEWVVRGGVFLLAGLLGLGALGLSLIAILLVVRFSRR